MNIKVLLVDDHPITREGISNLLTSRKTNIEVIGEASDGYEAIAKVKELKPDVVVMDISMPTMDGLEATRQIKKDFPKTKVLVLTQFVDREYILSTIKAGADGYIPKRAMIQDLITGIQAVFDGQSFLYPTAAGPLIDGYRRFVEREPYDTLTDREREIFRLIANGYTTSDIATKLFISVKTVRNHRVKIMEKLDVHNISELIKIAMQKGLITDK